MVIALLFVFYFLWSNCCYLQVDEVTIAIDLPRQKNIISEKRKIQLGLGSERLLCLVRTAEKAETIMLAG